MAKVNASIDIQGTAKAIEMDGCFANFEKYFQFYRKLVRDL